MANDKANTVLKPSGGRVTKALIENLIATNDLAALDALYSSDVAALDNWDQEAWSKFLDWNSRS